MNNYHIEVPLQGIPFIIGIIKHKTKRFPCKEVCICAPSLV